MLLPTAIAYFIIENVCVFLRNSKIEIERRNRVKGGKMKNHLYCLINSSRKEKNQIYFFLNH